MEKIDVGKLRMFLRPLRIDLRASPRASPSEPDRKERLMGERSHEAGIQRLVVVPIMRNALREGRGGGPTPSKASGGVGARRRVWGHKDGKINCLIRT